MATIQVNGDNTLALVLTADERATFNFLSQGQLAEYITIWLADRFKTTWKDMVKNLTGDQKKQLQALLAEEVSAEVTPADEVKA